MIIWQTEQRARVEHYCDRCGLHIYPGEWYVRTAKRIDGHLFVIKEHAYWCEEEVEDRSAVNQYAYATVGVAIALEVRQVAVQRVLVNGETVTEFEPKVVPTSELAPMEMEPDDFDDDDIPF